METMRPLLVQSDKNIAVTLDRLRLPYFHRCTLQRTTQHFFFLGTALMLCYEFNAEYWRQARREFQKFKKMWRTRQAFLLFTSSRDLYGHVLCVATARPHKIKLLPHVYMADIAL